MTIEQQIADLTTATTDLTTQALALKAAAEQKMNNGEVYATNAAASEAQAVLHKAAAQMALADAQQARDQAQAAQATATAIAYGDMDWTVPAVTELLPGINAVAVCLYDTSTDRDDGEWTTRTGSLSYGKEERCTGRYLGAFSGINEAEAAGGTVGDYFYNTSDKNFRRIDSLNPDATTVIYRAGSATFPRRALIVAEAGRVYVLDVIGEPTMWMVFTVNTGTPTLYTLVMSGGTISSIAATSGKLMVSTTINGAFVIDFALDEARRLNPSILKMHTGLASRNGGVTYVDGGGYVIVDSVVNSIATRIADDAPVHPVSGLPMPTIAVGTNGGVSVLNPDDNGGWSVESYQGPSGYRKLHAVSYHGDRLLTLRSADAAPEGQWVSLHNGQTSVLYSSGSTPPILGGYNQVTVLSDGVVASTLGISRLQENPADPTKGMVAHLTETYSTPLLVGDVQAALLCDGEEGVVTGQQFVSDPDFLVPANWSLGGAGLAISGGAVTATGSSYSAVTDQVGSQIPAGTPIVVTYTVTGTLTVRGYFGQGSPQFTKTGVGDFVVPAVQGNAGQPAITLSGDGTLTNFKVEKATIDRSGRGNHAVISGAHTRTKPVGSDLAYWGGFDTAPETWPLPAGTTDVYGVDYNGGSPVFYADITQHASVSRVGDDLTISGGEWCQIIGTKTTPSADQWRDIERDALAKLSKPSMLTGSVKALKHDPVRGDDWVACSDGQIHRLTRGGTTFEESIVADAGVGTINSLTVDNGEITIGGSTGVWVSQPARNLREPVAKKRKPRRKNLWFDGDNSAVRWYATRGWKVVDLLIDRVPQRPGVNEQYSVGFDGYRWFAETNLAAPGVTSDICLVIEEII